MEEMNGLPVVAHYENVRDMGSAEKFGAGARFGLAIGGAFLAIVGLCAATRLCEN